MQEAMDQALTRLEHAIGGLLERIEGERVERHALGAALDAARQGIDAAAAEIRAVLIEDQELVSVQTAPSERLAE